MMAVRYMHSVHEPYMMYVQMSEHKCMRDRGGGRDGGGGRDRDKEGEKEIKQINLLFNCTHKLTRYFTICFNAV